jgi:hypothetical protein
MGRKKKQIEERKVKFGISLDRLLFDKMVQQKVKKSSLINMLLKDYYGNKDM